MKISTLMRPSIAIVAVSLGLGALVPAAASGATGSAPIVIDDFETGVTNRTVIAQPTSWLMPPPPAAFADEAGQPGLVVLSGEGDNAGSVRLQYAFKGLDLTAGGWNRQLEVSLGSVKRLPELVAEETAVKIVAEVTDESGKTAASSPVAVTNSQSANLAFTFGCWSSAPCLPEPIDYTKVRQVAVTFVYPAVHDRMARLVAEVKRITAAPGPAIVKPVVKVTTSVASPAYGEPVTATAQVVPAAGASGVVQFKVDGVAVGAGVPVVDGQATSGQLVDSAGRPLAVATHRLTAEFTSASPNTMGNATQTRDLQVTAAATRTTLDVQHNEFVIDVASTTASTVAPQGYVRLYLDGDVIGAGGLRDGKLILVAGGEGIEPVDGSGVFEAVFEANGGYGGSRAKYTRTPPTIEAHLSSKFGPTKFGWYRAPVEVSFTCSQRSAPLAESCTDPVKVSTEGADQSVKATISATDGGWAMTEVKVSIDRKAPELRLRGVKRGAVYSGHRPRLRCVATDALSGVASCNVASVKHGKKVRYRAVATDKAGNSTVIRGHYTVRRAH